MKYHNIYVNFCYLKNLLNKVTNCIVMLQSIWKSVWVQAHFFFYTDNRQRFNCMIFLVEEKKISTVQHQAMNYQTIWKWSPQVRVNGFKIFQ